MSSKRQETDQSTPQARKKTALQALEINEQCGARLEIDPVCTAQARRTQRVDLNLCAFRYNASYDYSVHPSVVIGQMDKLCVFCGACRFKNEVPEICCQNGKVKLPELHSPPELLSKLLSGRTSQSKHFLANIRGYNSCFQMTSFGATNVPENYTGPLKVQGQIYHPAKSPIPLQIFFSGNINAEIEPEIVDGLKTLFGQRNKLIQSFGTTLDQMPAGNYKLVFKPAETHVGQHKKRYNTPIVDEVAVVTVGEEFNPREIILHCGNGDDLVISETHRSYDGLQYPILFWEGEDGYHLNIKLRNPQTGEETNETASAVNYYSYRLMIRKDAENHILKCGKLFHQYIADMYAKIEADQRFYIRNRRKFHSEEYIHLPDVAVNDGNANPNGSGKTAVLPAAFTESARNGHEYEQDAMTYVHAHGCPDLFITFTCNSAWCEIKHLLNGQSPSDRPDITARVFKQKLNSLMDFIVKHRVFGDTRCWMYSIEWQKRGLPHAHILIWLTKKVTSDQIDRIISAEIPDANVDRDLFEVVTGMMIHGPCGKLNENSPCMSDGKCTKWYPKKFALDTTINDNGYPLYRRRSIKDGGKYISKKIDGNHVNVDNSWIVPYSPLLSKAYKANINVEYCNNSVKLIKRLCQYVTKGSDMVNFKVVNATKPFKEIVQHQQGRYISCNEAVWRILSFPIYEQHPTVVCLPVYLENRQRATAENARAEEMLDGFFSLCSRDIFAKTLLYSEVPKYYIWNRSEEKFQRRKQGTAVEGYSDLYSSDVLARPCTVHPNDVERFCLRLLLINVRGPTSFKALKTVNDRLCTTYREACEELKLLESDAHWNNSLADASNNNAQPQQIRTLFAIILTMCSPPNPKDLWENYKKYMSEDILYRNAGVQFTPYVYNEALIAIEDVCLASADKALGELGMHPPDRSAHHLFNRYFHRETAYDVEKLCTYVQTNLPKLVREQRTAYDRIMHAIKSRNGGLYFLDAPAGTGKTFLISLILATVRSQNDIAVAVASTGIAATLLDGGQTAHSALKLRSNKKSIATRRMCNIGKDSGMGKVLQSCKIIIWDECTMAHKNALEQLDRTLQYLRGNKQLFGGVLVLLSGDFRQTLPIIRCSTPTDVLNACLKSSVLWRHVQRLTLKTNMRVQLRHDASAECFAKQLLDIGNGEINDSARCIAMDANFCNITASKDELIRKVFPNIAQNYKNHEWLGERAILAAKNSDVNDINFIIQNQIPGEEKTYNSIDTVTDHGEVVNYSTEFLNSLDLPGMPPHILTLKIGVPIVLLRNINPPRLCNGTRLSVKNMTDNIIEATILNGKFKGDEVLLPRIPTTSADTALKFERLQFPVRLAFAVTINKAQGQSLQVCGINLENSCFSHGQLYVACSRVAKPTDLFVYVPGGKTKNIVYQKALQ